MELNKEQIEQEVISKLKTIKDLELPISIYDLGLVYNIEVQDTNDKVHIIIEITTVNSRCSSKKSFVDLIVSTIISINEVDECQVKYVFSPKWELTMISQEGLEQLRNANKS